MIDGVNRSDVSTLVRAIRVAQKPSKPIKVSFISGSTMALQPSCSPSPRSRFSTHLNRQPIPSSIVNLTVDTHCNIWQIVNPNDCGQLLPSNDPTCRIIPSQRIHLLDDAKQLSNASNGRPLSNSSDESGVFMAGPLEHGGSSAPTPIYRTDLPSDVAAKKLLYTAHAQFSKEYDLVSSVDEAILLTEKIKPVSVTPTGDTSTEVASVKNQITVKIAETAEN